MLIKGKKIKFELTGNSSYPSSSYRCSTVFSSVYERWFLTAKVKETTVKSIGNRYLFLRILMANTTATTRQSTTCVPYLMTFPISDVS